MPKRIDLKSILIIGSGPIVIAQACEFDYAGVQACTVLKALGYRVVLLNSNPATIMTDPEYADATYIEPLIPEIVESILIKEKIDALLPTMGGQTSLNLAMTLARTGVLKRLGVELIGACPEAIEKAENRQAFRQAMQDIGLDCLRSEEVSTWDEAQAVLLQMDFPLIIRPSFTLGGVGGGVAHDVHEFETIVRHGLLCSPIHQILIEESVMGWKEYEIEVMRDHKDQCIVVCSIENVDPMGIHTGDSITVAPILTLTDKEYQCMRNAAFAVMREIGVATGGANVQFAVHPSTGRRVVIEMNPRVSRSSALASKVTGFPIAKIAAQLAVGYGLDEIRNEMTGTTYAFFEPSIDYIVTKIPYFDFEKFEGVTPYLTTYMQSVGEVMAIGRTFAESLQKAVRSLEQNFDGLYLQGSSNHDPASVKQQILLPTPHRIFHIAAGFRVGLGVEEIHLLCHWDRWFLRQIEQLVRMEAEIKVRAEEFLSCPQKMRCLKAQGFSDRCLSRLMGIQEHRILEMRQRTELLPSYRRIDTCAAEFRSQTAYLYSTTPPFMGSDKGCEAFVSNRPKVIVLGSGPNRIGQGIEFDYCCVHASFALKERGYESIMINCNPETVSTDHTISDRLYFSPLMEEEVLDIVRTEQSKGELVGVFVQFGGQTALKLAKSLVRAGVPLLGISLDAIDEAEDRGRFQQLIDRLGLLQPMNGIAYSAAELVKVVHQLGYPVILRPSYVLGGKGMQVVHSEKHFKAYLEKMNFMALSPVLVERYLVGAKECDVDALSDGREVWVAGIMEHFEPAGVHSGDSACVLPAQTLLPKIIAQLKRQTTVLAQALGVVGPLNVQFAVQEDRIYVIEVNPRASRTLPFVAKALGVPVVKMAVGLSLGDKISDLDCPMAEDLPYCAVKQPVFSFDRFRTVATQLGPVMKSTGEGMGLGLTPQAATARALLPMLRRKTRSSGPCIKRIGILCPSPLKPPVRDLIRALSALGVQLETPLSSLPGVNANAHKEEFLALLQGQQLDLLLSLSYDEGALDGQDNYYMLCDQAAHRSNTPVLTTLSHGWGVVAAFKETLKPVFAVKSLQAYYQEHTECVV